MAILETLITSVGIAVGKALFEGFLKTEIDDVTLESAATGASGALVDLFKKKVNDHATAREASAQLNQVANRVAKALKPIVDSEVNLDEPSKTAVIHAVGTAIKGFSATALFEARLKPSELATQFLKGKEHLVQDFNDAEKALFNRLLDEASNMLVKMGPKLPGFDLEAFKTVIENDNQLLKIMAEILAELQQTRQASQDPDQQSRDFEIRYRNELIANLNRMDHLGLGSLGDEVQDVPLDVAYVSLKARGSANRKRLADPILSEYQDYSIEEILTEARYLLIRGVAGCGKTTLLRWLAVQIAKNKLADGALSFWHNRVPFYIRLRDYTDKSLPSPENFLDFTAPNIKGAMPHGWVHQHLVTGGRGVILLDGVDELPEARRNSVRQTIASWRSSFPTIPILVTSRPSDEVRHDWLDSEDFANVEVLPLENERVNEFIQRWHNALAERKPVIKAELDDQAASLIEAIRQNKTLQDLATTPLLLSGLCVIHRADKKVLPENQTDLLAKLVEALLQRDEQREIRDPIDRKTREHHLRKLAYWMIRNNKDLEHREHLSQLGRI